MFALAIAAGQLMVGLLLAAATPGIPVSSVLLALAAVTLTGPALMQAIDPVVTITNGTVHVKADPFGRASVLSPDDDWTMEPARREDRALVLTRADGSQVHVPLNVLAVHTREQLVMRVSEIAPRGVRRIPAEAAPAG